MIYDVYLFPGDFYFSWQGPRPLTTAALWSREEEEVDVMGNSKMYEVEEWVVVVGGSGSVIYSSSSPTRSSCLFVRAERYAKISTSSSLRHSDARVCARPSVMKFVFFPPLACASSGALAEKRCVEKPPCSRGCGSSNKMMMLKKKKGGQLLIFIPRVKRSFIM